MEMAILYSGWPNAHHLERVGGQLGATEQTQPTLQPQAVQTGEHTIRSGRNSQGLPTDYTPITAGFIFFICNMVATQWGMLIIKGYAKQKGY